MSTHEQDVLDAAKLTILDSVGLAINTLREIATLGEKETSRIAAANSLLDRAGVVKPQQIAISVDQAEHDRASREAQELIEKLDKNRGALAAPQPSLEALVVHEGDDEGPAVPVPAQSAYPDALDA